MQIRDSVVVVTGASSGMGLSVAEKLLAEGAKVFALARSVDRMKGLEAAGATVIGMDISKDDQIAAAVARIEAEAGRVDVLINNAGFAVYGPVEEVAIDKAREQFEVNIFGLARITQLILPIMRRQGHGRIINVSSVGGRIYTPLGAWYHATKHALEGWSDALRLELKPLGIDVIVIRPGIIDTGFYGALDRNMTRGQADGPYGRLVAALDRAAGNQPNATKPGVVADTMIAAIRATRPRTRYAVGSMAKPLIFLRGLLSDRLFDRVIMSQVK
ncbi:short-chain dehydrogenase [Oceanicola sp. 22II-s10i]|uniref:oxidoreductase n=1 Tax=Oceanicola sp. 22II-s10i TaxID=1317116 RepID=UPI000B51F804|nr:oxidoreductase [Oceanicola sp. 22II-s10i]OWU84771.1 short-chain dehydrogenase [Oceanicola sp. 22II-s10i]